MRFLLIEDNADLARSVCARLSLEGHAADHAVSLADADDHLAAATYDLILLDITLPDGDGRSFLARHRAAQSDTPVIVLTARSAISDRVDTLDLGADDYLTKPFDFAELEARCRAVLRRQSGAAANQKTFADTVLDSTKGEITWGDQAVALRNRELRLLEIFYNAPGQVFSKTHLMDRLFAFSDGASENAIEVYVGRLRKRLEGSGATLETVRGMGYRLVAR